MERYLKDAEPQLKPEPVEDHILDFDSGWINTEFEEDFGPIKHELIIKSEPSDQDDTDDDRLSLDDLNIWDRGLCNRTEDSYSSPGQLSSSSSSSSIHSLDGDTPPFSPVVKLENNNVEKFTDFTILSQEGTRFPCHRLVLASQSPPLEAMMIRDTKEKQEGQVLLPSRKRW